jgi:hypothetical protein
VFSAVYTYGHLFTAALSLVMALAFLLLGLRVPAYRADLRNALVFVTMSAAAIPEMLLVLQPSPAVGRLYFSLMCLLFMSIARAFYGQFAAQLYSQEEQRFYTRALRVYYAVGALLNALLWTGRFDDGLRRLDVAGVHLGFLSLGWWQGALAFLYVCANVPLNRAILLRPGMRQSERRVLAAAMFLAPLAGAHDVLIAVGVNPSLPIGGYCAALAGVHGVFILIERFRALIDRRARPCGGR